MQDTCISFLSVDYVHVHTVYMYAHVYTYMYMLINFAYRQLEEIETKHRFQISDIEMK